ncbi:hypothetical protein Tco_0365090 [Tanacetum coccineum]
MAREAKVKKQRVFNTGNMMEKPVWTNTDKINHANQFVPRPIQLNTDRPNINSVRTNINTGRTNINSVRPRVNTVNSNVNTVRSRQPVPTRTSNSFSPKRPMDHPLKNMVDRGIFDSGCSGHMTGNKDQLEDFEEFNGGSVTFGGSKDYITGIAWFANTAAAKTLADGTLELHATIDTIVYTITEASIRNKLQLADASGITMLPNNEIFKGMGHMGYPTDGSFTFWKSFFTPQWRFLVHHILHCISSKSGGWDQFGSNIATALICLSTGRVYNFSKLIFDGMVANLKSKTKFLMYPRFLQMILDIQTENKHPYLAVTLTKKIFGNMKRGFRGVPRPLLPAMLSIANPSAGQKAPSVTQPQPSSSVVPPTPPSTQPIPSEATTIPPFSQPAPPTPIAETTNASPSPTPSPAHEPMEHTFKQPSTDQQPSTPSQEASTSQLMARIDDLEKQIKETK